jgi:F420H(2)-dependent biliverdin reductase
MTTRADRLKTDANLWFACMRADGRPHLTPIWFVWVDERAWLCTPRNAVKARIVAARPNVSIALEDGNAPVTGEGIARVVEIGSAPAAVADSFQAKFNWDVRSDSDYVFIEITITRWLFPSTEVVE